MTDTKSTPSAENVARAWRLIQVPGYATDRLAAEFAQSDAIARRRAIEEAADFLLQPDGKRYRCNECGEYVKPNYSACSPPADGGGG